MKTLPPFSTIYTARRRLLTGVKQSLYERHPVAAWVGLDVMVGGMASWIVGAW